MNKKKIELIVTGFLIMLFFCVVFSNFKPAEKETYKQSMSDVTKKNAGFKNVDYELLNEKFYRMVLDRDPFAIVTVKPVGYSNLLEGISWDPVSPAVLFGGVFLKTGDKIENYSIVDIKKEFVVLSDGKALYELIVGQSLDSLE